VRLQVDVSTKFVDLLRDGYDVALRTTYQVHPGLVARTVERNKFIAVAAPAYLAAHGTPRSVKELRRHSCLTSFARGELSQCTWPAGRGVAHIEGSFSSNDPGLLRDATVNGLGIALLPRLLVADLLESGVLVQVLAGVVERSTTSRSSIPSATFSPRMSALLSMPFVAWAPALHHAPGAQAPVLDRRTSRRAVKK